MRVLLIFGFVFLTCSCGSEDSKSELDLTGTWGYENSDTNYYQQIIIKDKGNEIELTHCGSEPKVLLKDSNGLFYPDGQPHHYTIVTSEKIQSKNDLGGTSNLNKISDQIFFENGSFSIKSDDLIDQNFNFNVCIKKYEGKYAEGGTTKGSFTGIEIVDYGSSPISLIRLVSESIDTGSFQVTNWFGEQEIKVDFQAKEFIDLYGQSVMASTGTVWIDTYTVNGVSGSGVVELNEFFDNRLIEFSFDINM